MLLAGATRVDILDPEQEAPALLPREAVGEQGGIGMAEMEPPGRGRSEAAKPVLSDVEGQSIRTRICGWIASLRSQ